MPRKIAKSSDVETPDQADVKMTSTPIQADAPAAVTLPFDQLKELLAIVTAAQNRSPELETAVAAIQALTTTQAKYAEQQKRTVGVSNAVGDDTGLSAFTFDPECAICRSGGDHVADHNGETIDKRKKAHPKAALKYKAFLCGSPLTLDLLTPLEASLVNSFTGAKDARGGYGPNGEDGGWSARLVGKGGTQRLEIWLPFHGQDVRANLPSLAQIMTELLYGVDAVDQAGQIGLIQKLQLQLAEQGKKIDALTQASHANS